MTPPAKAKLKAAKEAPREPRIVAFCCNWCSYAGADLAGVSRVQIPPNFRIVRIMCSGRMDPELAVRLLREGMDGVLVLGCHPGDCHYIEGNYFAEIKMQWTQELLSQTDFGADRLMLDWVSASEDQRFAQIVGGFQERIKEMMGAYCPVLKCAMEKKAEYCLSCKEFPCEVHYKWEIPYSRRILDLHKKFKDEYYTYKE